MKAKTERIIKRTVAGVMSFAMTAAATNVTAPVITKAAGVEASDTKIEGFSTNSALQMQLTARYNAEVSDADGGCLEIVAYNEKNGYAYAVSGVKGKIIITGIDNISESTTVNNLTGTEFNVSESVSGLLSGFEYGDITSVAVSPDGTKLAAAIQSSTYNKKGVVAVYDCNADGSLSNPQLVEVGVQPDMVTFTPDGSKILSADEGEPRNGYGDGTEDPMGTVTVISTSDYEASIADFTDYDTAANREALVASNVILKKDTAPSVDFEPEYIACDNEYAYVSLQEANAIAVLDLSTNEFTDVYSLGTQDFSEVAVDLNKADDASDKGYSPDTYANVYGLRMPDGITMYNDGTDTYILTANEGDSREWGTEGTASYFLNEAESKLVSESGVQTDKKVVYLDTTTCDGLDSDNKYLFGTRSYSIFKVTSSGLSLVYDSLNEFETVTAQYLPDNFNSSNDDATADDRSGKKGCEPEYVTVGTIGDRTYAFIGLERVGGIMAYDITDMSNVEYANYINSRDSQMILKVMFLQKDCVL